jgi:hypothetical protein
VDVRSEAEKTRDMNEVYRHVFRTEQGREVLTDILNDCGFFSLDDISNEADIARLNVAKNILHKAGIWIPGYVRELVDRLLDLPIPYKE